MSLDTRSLSRFTRALREIPKSLGIAVAKRAAPEITKYAASTFEQSADPYGIPWAPGADGGKVKLEKTGSLRKFIAYVAIGTRIRVSLGVPYAKYQIGKRPVYPKQGGTLPAEYSETLAAIVADELEGRIIRGGL
jgi:hypothetical protein